MTAGMTLTPRELEVAALVAEGLTNKEIAARLVLSERTAEGHVEHIRDKLGFSTRSQIASWYTQSRGAPAAAMPAATASTRAPGATARGRFPRRVAFLGTPLLVAIIVAATVILSRPSGPTLVLYAGLGTDGNSGDGGPALVAQFSELESMFFDSDDRLVVADSQGGFAPQVGMYINRTHIRRIARDGTITTVAGDGALDFAASASGAALNIPGTACAARGPTDGSIVVSLGYDDSGAVVGRIDADGTFHLLAGRAGQGYSGDGGPATGALLRQPGCLAVDRTDGTVYFIDAGNDVVRAILPNGTIRTVVGTGQRGNSGDDGPPTAATLYVPLSLALSADGSLFIADTNNDRVRRIDHGGTLRREVDGGLSKPSSLAFGPGDVLYVADTGNARVLRITPDAAITTVAGPDQLVRPTALAVDASGALYIGDSGRHQIFRLLTR